MKMGDFFNRLVSDFFTSESFWHNEVSDLLKMFPFLYNHPESNLHTHSKDRYYAMYPYVSRIQDSDYDFLRSKLSDLASLSTSDAYKNILGDIHRCEAYFKKASLVRRRVLLARWNMAIISQHISQAKGDNLSLSSITVLPDKVVAKIAANPKIKSLEITDSQILNLPESIELLTGIKSLKVSNTTLEYLPGVISFLTNLEHLDLSDNNIRYIPCGIEKLKKLKFLDITGNKIKALPSYKTFHKFLNKLELCSNQIIETQSKLDSSNQVGETLGQYWATRLGQQPLSK